MENLEIYNRIKTVPTEARKKITGGRLNGMTDIKPMWRIEKLTEVFGPCGFGWKTEITNKEIIDGANGEKIAIVDLNLYVRIDDQWSEAIQGTGGSSFVAKEKTGLYTSDECFKMATTDALSVACKSLGMGAEVYWGMVDTKYESNKELTKEDAENYEITFGKHKGKTLKDLVEKSPDYLDYLINNSNDTRLLQAIEMLTGQVKLEDEELEAKAQKTLQVMMYEQKGVDLDKVKESYGVDSINNMTSEQLDDCIAKLKKKYGE